MNSGRYGQHNLKIIGLILGAMVIIRSEERRVGKEC